MTLIGKEIGELLVDNGLLTPEDLGVVEQEKLKTGESISKILARLGFASENQLKDTLELNYGVTFVSLAKLNPDPDLVKQVPEEVIRQLQVVPISLKSARLTLAMVNPDDSNALAEIRNYIQADAVKSVVCIHDDFDTCVDQLFGTKAELSPGTNGVEPAEDLEPDLSFIDDTATLSVRANGIITGENARFGALPAIDAAVASPSEQENEAEAAATDRPPPDLGELLLSKGIIDDDQLYDAMKVGFKTNQSLAEVLISMELVTEDDLQFFLAEYFGSPLADSFDGELPRQESEVEAEYSSPVVKAEIGADDEQVGVVADELPESLEDVISDEQLGVTDELISEEELEFSEDMLSPAQLELLNRVMSEGQPGLSNELLAEDEAEIVDKIAPDELPAIADELLLEEEPETLDQLVAEEESEILDQVVAEEEPEILDQAVDEEEPEVTGQVVAEEEPEILDQVVAEEEPEILDQGVAEEEPEILDQVVAEEEPEILDQVVAEEEPVVADQVVAEEEPVVAGQVVAEEEPEIVSKAVVQEEPEVINEVITEKPKVVEEAAPEKAPTPVEVTVAKEHAEEVEEVVSEQAAAPIHEIVSDIQSETPVEETPEKQSENETLKKVEELKDLEHGDIAAKLESDLAPSAVSEDKSESSIRSEEATTNKTETMTKADIASEPVPAPIKDVVVEEKQTVPPPVAPSLTSEKSKQIAAARGSESGDFKIVDEDNTKPSKTGLIEQVKAPVKLVKAETSQFDLNKSLQPGKASAEQKTEVATTSDLDELEDDIDFLDLVKQAQYASISLLANHVTSSAIEQKCSDILVQGISDNVVVQYLKKGRVVSESRLVKQILPDLVACYKEMAGLDKTVTNKPQDRKVKLNIRETDIELRVTTVPEDDGEIVAISIKYV